MIKRYPDKAAIVFVKEKEVPSGLNGADTENATEQLIDCRYEPRDSFSGNYSAKIFTPSVGLQGFEGDGLKLKFRGREFDILKISPHQTHSEIWLK